MDGKKIIFFPLINLQNGLCSFCHKNVFQNINSNDTYSNPSKFCFILQNANAKAIIFKDYDSYYGNNNSANIESIVTTAKNIHIRINVLANFKSTDECRYLLDNDIHQVILDELLLSNENGVAKLLEDYTNSRIAAGIITKNNKIIFKDTKSNYNLFDFITIVNNLKISRIFYFEKEWEENDCIDLKNIKKISEKFNFKITLSAGISDSKQLINLINQEHYNIDSILLGDPLFENKFPCQKIWRFY